MTRRFVLIALLSALVIGLIVVAAIASADEDREGFSTEEVTGPPQPDVPQGE